MSDWAPKRFYKDATVETEGDGFAVRLDGRPVRTPGKRPLVVPTRPMAERIAAEWQAQEKTIDPRTMPWTRSANSALDKVAVQRDEIMDHLVSYAGTDLLYYRAIGPAELTERQAATWDPILRWAETRYDVRLRTTEGVMPVEQDASVSQHLQRAMEPMTDFQLTGFYELVVLSGSYLVALASVEALEPPESLWSTSRIDEDWQTEQWGVDEEAAEAAGRKRSDFLHAVDFYKFA